MIIYAGFLLCCIGLVACLYRRINSGAAFFAVMSLHFYVSDFLSDRLYYTSSAALCLAVIILVKGKLAKGFIFIAFAALLTNVVGFVMYEMGEPHFIYNALFALIYFAGCALVGIGSGNAWNMASGNGASSAGGDLC
jgi:hypothetical protein